MGELDGWLHVLWNGGGSRVFGGQQKGLCWFASAAGRKQGMMNGALREMIGCQEEPVGVRTVERSLFATASQRSILESLAEYTGVYLLLHAMLYLPIICQVRTCTLCTRALAWLSRALGRDLASMDHRSHVISHHSHPISAPVLKHIAQSENQTVCNRETRAFNAVLQCASSGVQVRISLSLANEHRVEPPAY
jgi:hypothetical protein